MVNAESLFYNSAHLFSPFCIKRKVFTKSDIFYSLVFASQGYITCKSPRFEKISSRSYRPF